MMKWDQLLSAARFGQKNDKLNKTEDIRTQFQRDYDRIIFSSPFRRLQNKTQVFPLPGSVFVHNRLTHSLEVASVGRSISNTVSRKIIDKDNLPADHLISEIDSIVGAACLAHDMGNPPFGHAGEEAIARFFKKENKLKLKELVNENQWNDFINFEGNANALRLLSHQFNGRRKGGFALTYSTLASIVKYPYGSDALKENKKKFGYFQSEKDSFIRISEELHLQKETKQPVSYSRHPLVFLVEAADDICYEIMDIEDAHKLSILSTAETTELFLNFFPENEYQGFHKKLANVHRQVADTNERIAFLRASVINKLVNEVSEIFLQNQEEILNGKFKESLMDNLTKTSQKAFNICQKTAIDYIYKHPSVVKIELTGFKVIGTLLEEFLTAVYSPREKYSKKLLSLLPEQYKTEDAGNYERIQSVVDFVSGMTDLYAVELFKNIKGINL